jgi:hypothetical protein
MEGKMEEWIPFREGEYIVERCYLLAPGGSFVEMEDAAISVYRGADGARRMDGQCKVENLKVVSLLDDHDSPDLLLDLGGRFKYVLRDPVLKSGKVFAPHVKSSLHFLPREPWEPVSEAEFEGLLRHAKPL